MGLDEVDPQICQGERKKNRVERAGAQDGRNQHYRDVRVKRRCCALVRHHPVGLKHEIGDDMGVEEGGKGFGHGVPSVLLRCNSNSSSQARSERRRLDAPAPCKRQLVV